MFAHLGESGTWLTGDMNYDLFIDAGDAGVVFGALGQSFDPGLAPLAVPEPGTLGLLTLGLGFSAVLLASSRSRLPGGTLSRSRLEAQASRSRPADGTYIDAAAAHGSGSLVLRRLALYSERTEV